MGIPADATPRPGRDSSKKIRKPPSGIVTAVAVRPRPPVTVTPRPSRALLIGGFSLAGAILFALGSLFAPVPERTTRLLSQSAAPQQLEKTNRVLPQEVEKSTRLNSPEAEKTTGLISQELEAKADLRHDEIQEAASALADEGRFEDALARIKTFPAEYRNTRAWNSLEGLRRQIESRARSK